MKSKQILLLFLLLFSLPFSYAQKLKVNANPINIASQLVLDTDSASIASTLDYYGYTLHSTDKAKTVYRHPDGTLITLSFPPADVGTRYIASPESSSDNGRRATSNADTPKAPISGDGKRETGNVKSRTATFPTIQVKSKVSEKEIKKILENMNYKKAGSHYEQDASRYSSYITRCTTSSKSVTFQRLKK